MPSILLNTSMWPLVSYTLYYTHIWSRFSNIWSRLFGGETHKGLIKTNIFTKHKTSKNNEIYQNTKTREANSLGVTKTSCCCVIGSTPTEVHYTMVHYTMVHYTYYVWADKKSSIQLNHSARTLVLALWFNVKVKSKVGNGKRTNWQETW